MKYPIYVYGSSVLRKETQEITKEFDVLSKLIEDMFETMHAADGVGLAAPQIGKDVRLFVVDVPDIDDEEEDDDLIQENLKRAFINPKIYEFSEECDYFEEGCLSVPGISEEVVRSTTIRIKYFDENFVEHDEMFTGFQARVIQHEYDHLEGKMFVDRVSQLRKQLIKSKLEKITKGNFKSTYPRKLVK